MNPETLVDRLAPLRTPEAVSWWPPAPGWWILAAIALAIVALLLRYLWRYHRRGRPLRVARAIARGVYLASAAPGDPWPTWGARFGAA